MFNTPHGLYTHPARAEIISLLTGDGTTSVQGVKTGKHATLRNKYTQLYEFTFGQYLDSEFDQKIKTFDDFMKIILNYITKVCYRGPFTRIAFCTSKKLNPRASGIVIESKIEKGKGSVITLLVNSGTIRVGDIIVVGTENGKVRALINDLGERVTEAKPSSPIEVLGHSGTPIAFAIA